MSEGISRSLKCLSCWVVVRQEAALPAACPACGAAWTAPGVAVVEHGDQAYETPDGASVLRDA